MSKSRLPTQCNQYQPQLRCEGNQGTRWALPGRRTGAGTTGGEAKVASALVHRIEASLKQQLGLGVGFAMYPHEPVRDARHLRHAFGYVVTQHDHHDLQTDPYRESTNLPDLLGLRLVGCATHANVRRWLPRISGAQLLGWLGAPRLEPADVPLETVVEATLGAACLGELHGSIRPVQEARGAIMAVSATA